MISTRTSLYDKLSFMRNYIVILFVALISSSAISNELPVTTRVSASLNDGSIIKAEAITENISGRTLFANKLTLKCSDISTLSFANTNGDAKVVLSNGDSITMHVTDRILKIKSAIGALKIPVSSVRALTFNTIKAPGPTGSTDGLVYACSFDNGIDKPEVGPAGMLELGVIRPEGGRTGGALLVKPGVAGAQIRFPAGSFGATGCIEFWANLQSGKTEFSTGGDPRFFLLSTADGNEVSHFEYASNDGCGHCGLTAHVTGVRVFSHEGCRGMMPYSDIFNGKDFNGWHHYALSWTKECATIYLDGKECCRSYGIVQGDALAGEMVLDIPLNRTRGKSYNNKSAFLMDDLKIWNHAKAEFDVNP